VKRYQFSRGRVRERVHLLKPEVTKHNDHPGIIPIGYTRISWCGRECEVGREYMEYYFHAYVPEPHLDLVTCLYCLVALKESGQIEVEVVP
jgi:hypothetical protein